MSEFNLDDETKKDLDHTLLYWCKKGEKPSEVGYRCANLLARLVGGLHHVDHDSAKKAEWSNARHVSINMGNENFATFDFNTLTRLVFLAHELCIRVELRAVRGCIIQLMMHPRHTREGGMCERHPTIEQALEVFAKVKK